MNKIIDCITFYDENLLTNARFEILKDVVDKFIVCESLFDHSGNSKKINFKLKNKNFSDKVEHIVIRKIFQNQYNHWNNEKIQRELILQSYQIMTQMILFCIQTQMRYQIHLFYAI